MADRGQSVSCRRLFEEGDTVLMKTAALAAMALALGLIAQPISAAETTESQLFSNISSTTAAFALKGGKYQACVVATFGGGSVKLRTLGPDGSSYLSVSSGTDFTANGCATIDLAPGQFEFVIATATAVFANIASIPY
jgi:hypothetical protein